MLDKIINERQIPDLQEFLDKSNIKSNEAGRRLILDLLLREEYGYLPPLPDSISYEIAEENNDWFAGKASYIVFKLTAHFEENSFTFPVRFVRHNGNDKRPVFVHINFRPEVPDRYQPTEEIIDNGYDVISFCYNEVTMDNGDFTNGLAGVVFENGKRQSRDCGKIAMWSWAASRVIDLLYELDATDNEQIYVTGHSRLGKTALLTAALDERVRAVFVNNSGCCGDAISRGKKGERIKDITSSERFWYWFTNDFSKYADNEDKLPFDQHFLVAAVAPRLVHICTAKLDTWADPQSQYLSCMLASGMWQNFNKTGFIGPNELPENECTYFEGSVGYNLRNGTHSQSRDDWNKYFEFLKIKRANGEI